MSELTEDELKQVEDHFKKEVRINLDGRVVPNKSFSRMFLYDNERVVIRLTEYEGYVEVFYISRVRQSEDGKPKIEF